MNTIAVPMPTVAGTPYGGGIYAGRFAVGEQIYGLVVAPVDGGELAPTKWGGLKKVAGALSYCDGLGNTHAMAAAGIALAKWAQGLRLGDCNDWYVPSRLEALLMFGELQAQGGFERDWYWTSTQFAGVAGYAWYQDFRYGNQGSHHESAELRARAVRRLTI